MSRAEKLQQYALVAEILSAVAIVASLIFVGIQLQQSATASQIAAYQSRADAASGALVAMALSEEISALRVKLRREGPDALSEVELERLRAWYQGTMLRAQAQYYQYQQGYLNQAGVDGMIRNMAGNYPAWDALGMVDLIEIPELRTAIESYIATHGNPASD
jgi:hypothetical protein